MPAAADAHHLEAGTSQVFVQGLARGLAVLRCFDAEHQRLRLSEIAGRTGMSRATARRSVLTLEALGYVRTEDRHFELTPRVLELGYAYLSGSNLARLARVHLDELSHDQAASTSISVLDGAEILYLARVHRHGYVRMDLGAGTRIPALVTAMGRVLLSLAPEPQREAALAVPVDALTPWTVTDPAALRAELASIARQGWSHVEQEFEVGLRATSVPLLDGAGNVLAAINLSLRVPPGDVAAADEVDQRVQALRTTAAAITRTLRIAREGG